VSLSFSLEADCVRDRTQGLFHRFLAITSCCTDGVQLTLQNLGGQLEMLCRRLATCILQQCRRRRGHILLQWLDGALHRRVVTTDQRSEAPIPRRSAWRHARSRWTPGTAVAADAAWCADQGPFRQPLQQVASSVCSLSASSTSVTQPCST